MASNPNKRLLLSEQAPDRLVETYEASSVIDIYVDGAGRTWTGAQVSKIELFRMTSIVASRDGKQVEEREVVMRLSIPTPVLMEACAKILGGAATNIAAIEAAGEQAKKAVKDAITATRAIKL